MRNKIIIIIREEKSVCQNASVFNIKCWPKSDDELEEYGQDEVEVLARHFKDVLEKKGFKSNLCVLEWVLFKKIYTR